MESDYKNLFEDQRVAGLKKAFKMREKLYYIALEPYLIGHEKETTELKIDMRQGQAALKYIGYNFDEKLLKRLFNAKSIDGKKTAKMLFDELNNKSRTAERELAEREQGLFADINAFKSKIREFDQAK